MCQGILFVLRLFFRTGRLCLSLHRSLLSSIDSGQCQTARLTNSSCNNHEPMKYLNMPTYPTCLTDACVRFLYCATLVRHLLQSISVAYAFDTRNTHPSVTPFQAPVRKPPPPLQHHNPPQTSATHIRQKLTKQHVMQCNNPTPTRQTPGERGAIRSAETAWKSQTYKDRHLRIGTQPS